MAFTPRKEKAVRLKAKASILIEGLSGSGKSGAAIEIATALCKGKQDNLTAVDTENKSLNLYDGVTLTSGIKCVPLDVYPITPEDGYAPTNYLACKEEAVKEGKEVLIMDSITHAWNRTGGVLDLVNKIQNTSKNPNKWAAWNDPEVVSELNALYDMLRDDRIHIVMTVRSKEKHETQEENGKKKIVSLGEQQIMQEGLKYEVDLVLRALRQGSTKNGKVQYAKVEVLKSRYAIFVEGEQYELTPEITEQLRNYLEEGVDPEILLEQQRKEYIELLKPILQSNVAKKSIAEVIKEDAGFKDTKYSELPLYCLKRIFATLNN